MEPKPEQILESLANPVVAFDKEGCCTYVSRLAADVLGTAPEEMLGRSMWELFPADRDSGFREACELAWAEGRPVTVERFSRVLGLWVEAHIHPTPAGAVAQWSDITERKRSGEALLGALQRLNAHMDNSPLAIIEFDPEFRVQRWSKGAERIFGWTAEEILGRAIPDFHWVYEEDTTKVLQVSEDMMQGRRPRNLNVNRNYRKDGAVIECEWYNSAIYDVDGKLASIFSQVLDITERSRHEASLRQAQKLESVGLLAGGIAHDFNNLLTGIMGNASLALEDAGPRAGPRIQEVLLGAERAASLTRQLLAYSGKGGFAVQEVDVQGAVNELAGLVRFSIPEGAALTIAAPTRLLKVRMDPSQLQQVLMNLLINAGEALGEGGSGTITVSTSLADLRAPQHDALGEEIAPGRYVCIEVRDNGSGIGERDRSRIFDPFFTTKFTGRGLGLAAVAGIVRAQHGGITLESVEGQGTTFRVFLPAAGEPETVRDEPATRGTILVVDDDAAVRDFIAAVLRNRSFRVLKAEDGREALSLFLRENGTIQAVVLDLVMPVMSGTELLPSIQAMGPDVKVLLTSGYSEEEARRLCAAYPKIRFIQKPYTSQEIGEAVEELLAKAR